MSAPCDGCGAVVAGGTSGCRARYDEVLARDYSDPRYFACHKLVVDCYSLQHPDEFYRSAKSLAGHLVSLALAIEGGPTDRPGAGLKRWLDGRVSLAKPPLPIERGQTTLPDLSVTSGPEAWRVAVSG